MCLVCTIGGVDGNSTSENNGDFEPPSNELRACIDNQIRERTQEFLDTCNGTSFDDVSLMHISHCAVIHEHCLIRR
jgi:hypothetical protein